jgi:hypothetical protein
LVSGEGNEARAQQWVWCLRSWLGHGLWELSGVDISGRDACILVTAWLCGEGRAPSSVHRSLFGSLGAWSLRWFVDVFRQVSLGVYYGLLVEIYAAAGVGSRHPPAVGEWGARLGDIVGIAVGITGGRAYGLTGTTARRAQCACGQR